MKYTINILNKRNGYSRSEIWGFHVDRGTPAGNPFIMHGDEALRDSACTAYNEWFYGQLERDGSMLQAYLNLMLKSLRRHKRLNLYCWCTPKRCHALTIKNYLLKRVKEKKNGST